MKHPPREGDLPREELLKAAKKATAPGGQWPGASVIFKCTCPHCGERLCMDPDNTLWENIECFKCGQSSKVEYGGFMVHFKIIPGGGE